LGNSSQLIGEDALILRIVDGDRNEMNAAAREGSFKCGSKAISR